MRLIALGDCVADRYIDEGIYFPGGQAVNVAVNAKRDGAEVSAYVGLFGDDVPAQYIQQVLADEGVVTARCRHAYGHTPGPSVRIVDGERIFGRGERDSVAHLFRLRLVDEDFAYLSTFDVCHTTNDAGWTHSFRSCTRPFHFRMTFPRGTTLRILSACARTSTLRSSRARGWMSKRQRR